MLEIRIHARGGQGAVLLGRMLATAFFKNDYFVQTFPTFGAERRGSPVMSFLRVDRFPVRERCSMLRPDHLIILSDNLFQEADLNLVEGLKPGGHIVINSDRSPEEFPELKAFHVSTFNCSTIAQEYNLGTPPTLIINTAMLGAFTKITGLTDLNSLEAGLNDWLPPRLVARNFEAARAAYQQAIPHAQKVEIV